MNEENPQLQKWLEEKGIQISIMINPEMIELRGAKDEVIKSVNDSKVSAITMMKYGLQQKTVISHEVEADKEKVRALLVAQFEKNLDDLLDVAYPEMKESSSS